MRESPAAGQLAAYALDPTLQSKSRDMQDPGNRRRMRARVSASRASGSWVPAMPRSLHAMPHRPIAVSNSAKP